VLQSVHNANGYTAYGCMLVVEVPIRWQLVARTDLRFHLTHQNCCCQVCHVLNACVRAVCPLPACPAGAARVVLTDLGHVLPLAEQNADANLGPPHQAASTATATHPSKQSMGNLTPLPTRDAITAAAAGAPPSPLAPCKEPLSAAAAAAGDEGGGGGADDEPQAVAAAPMLRGGSWAAAEYAWGDAWDGVSLGRPDLVTAAGGYGWGGQWPGHDPAVGRQQTSGQAAGNTACVTCAPPSPPVYVRVCTVYLLGHITDMCWLRHPPHPCVLLCAVWCAQTCCTTPPSTARWWTAWPTSAHPTPWSSCPTRAGG
jgi:hypothetical protein